MAETQSDEDEPALFTAQVCEVRTLGSPELMEMTLYEEKVVPKEIEKKNNIWSQQSYDWLLKLVLDNVGYWSDTRPSFVADFDDMIFGM